MSKPLSQKPFGGAIKLRVRLARIASTTNLAALFGAGTLYVLGSSGVNDTTAYIPFAFLLHAIVLTSGMILLTTGVYRVVGGGASDEFEVQMAHKAMSISFVSLGVSLLLSVFLLHVWSSGVKALSMMQVTETLGGMVWAIIDLLLVLPAAILSWLLPVDAIEEA